MAYVFWIVGILSAIACTAFQGRRKQRAFNERFSANFGRRIPWRCAGRERIRPSH